MIFELYRISKKLPCSCDIKILCGKYLPKIKIVLVLDKCVSYVKILELFFDILNLCHFFSKHPKS